MSILTKSTLQLHTHLVDAQKPPYPNLETSLEQSVTSRPLPKFQSRIQGTVQLLDWRKQSERDIACKLLQQHAAGDPDGPTAPLLIRAAVSDWPALQRWSLDHFQECYANYRVMVRCAPTMRFFYTEPRLLPLWRKFHSIFRPGLQPPSDLLPMCMGDFIARMQAGCTLPHAIYPESGEEFYYLQTFLAPGMLRDVDLYSSPLSCLGLVPGEPPVLEPAGLRIAQVPRLFVSPQGAISPLHFDTASSFLTQIRGRKRLIFYQPEEMSSLYPYSRWHILRRRSKVDPAKPDLARFPKFGKLIGVEARLEPGDVLFFPGLWSHYTESIDLSVSMTYRFWTDEQGKRSKKGFCLL